jgi:ribulose 1,5-bisphosphate synthetase/thiazole synthase
MFASSKKQSLKKQYDVVVVGGGASGLIAAKTAARNGATTLLVERQGCLGGVGTTCYVAQYIGFFNRELQAVWGTPNEFLKEIVKAGGSDGFTYYTMAEASASPINIYNFPFNPEVVKYVADDFVQEENIDVLFHAQVVDALVRNGIVSGVRLQCVAGRIEVAAKAIVDATGDATVAHLAGVQFLTDSTGIDQNQPTSLVFRLSNVDVKRFRAIPRERKRELALAGVKKGEIFWESLSFMSTPGGHDAICLMSRIRGLDMLDAIDVSEAEYIGRRQVQSIVKFLQENVDGFEKAVIANIAARVGVRETRRIRGRHVLTLEDILEDRQFPDSVALGCGPVDVHDPNGTGISLMVPERPWQIPMRSLLPDCIEGLIVTGRAISATHEANGGSRHMATAMALGEAAGTMAAIATDMGASMADLDQDIVRDRLRAQSAATSVEDCRRLTAREPNTMMSAQRRPIHQDQSECG